MLPQLSKIGSLACRISSHFLNIHKTSWFDSSSIRRSLHKSCVFLKEDDRRYLISSSPTKDQGTDGEKSLHMDAVIQSRSDMFPTERTMDTLFNGMPFNKIPICNIRASKNNTIITITDAGTGKTMLLRSCGIEGFKNTRKGTNVAAQATAITFGNQAKSKGFETIRVRVSGLGPGRLSAIKGLQMTGLNIISVTDSTPVSWFPPRPRKQRKL